MDSPTKGPAATHITQDSVMSDQSPRPHVLKKDMAEQNEQHLAQVSQRIERVKRLLAMPPDQTKDMGASANPMLGHSETLIFTRITGHPDYPEVD